ncbi:uncharacterized protein LOC110848074 [Folsomia candida]|uniref:uncharacterized protein LOC110848074 n=1 Tax=Folsomia candida TaxID=158441 RepID=UPI001605180B|nr:uncharacterized protein LOC110848074 [Folsomia candida]
MSEPDLHSSSSSGDESTPPTTKKRRGIFSDSSESDFKKVQKKRKRRRKKPAMMNVLSSDSDDFKDVTKHTIARRVTRSAVHTSGSDKSSRDSGFRTSASLNSRSLLREQGYEYPSTEESSTDGVVTFRYRTHKIDAIFSHRTKSGKNMFKLLNQQSEKARSKDAIINGIKRRYKHKPPEFSRPITPPILSPESETDEDVEVDGKKYKLKKVGISKYRIRGKFRRMYVTEMCPIKNPCSREVGIK